MGCTETIIENGRAIYRDCHTHRPAGEHAEPPAGGPGTELKKLLAGWPLWIVAKPNCSCNARARTMDSKGCDWVAANESTVVGWLREEAAKRSLPFLDAVGKLLVRRAISNARKEERRAQAQGGQAAV
jgi:hypothetical protein